jgi:hypothetical protein
VYNVTYDLWLTNSATPDATTTPTEEIMVWLNYSKSSSGTATASPIGSVVASNISVAGATWNLYYGKSTTAAFYTASYVRVPSATTSVTDMMAFLRDLRSRSGYMPAGTQYLMSIQAGTEVTSGSGELDTTGFYCR